MTDPQTPATEAGRPDVGWHTTETLAAVNKLADIGDIAIEYVKASHAQWQEAKDAYETDDDLDPEWVKFRDQVLALASEADALWPDRP